MPAKADILARLQRDILSLQGFKMPAAGVNDVAGLGRINLAFPNGVFPVSAVHEFFCHNAEEATASTGFIAGLLSSIIQQNGVVLWVATKRFIFPPALLAFGLRPEQVIFIYLKNEKEVAWVTDEALKCGSLAAVVGEMDELDFTASRRFQLAIEKSQVPLFVIRQNPKNQNTTAVARWQIKPISSRLEEGLPGVGFPRWEVNLLRVRNGKPGRWELEWRHQRFRHASKLALLHQDLQIKTG